MARPRKFRNITWQPEWKLFTPIGDKTLEVEELILNHDEIESIRLKDLECLDQKQASEKMNISQPTFCRLVKEARKKVAKALINGNAIKIQEVKFKSLKNKL